MVFSSNISVEKLNESQLTLHHSVQFIAIAGKYLLEKKDDDSHTNMSWDSRSEMFYGDSINGRARVGFHIPSQSLKVTGPTGIELASLPLINKTKQECFVWLQQALQLKQIDTTSMKPDLHYEIPDHPSNDGKIFPVIGPEILKELANHRTIADQVCSDIFAQHTKASPARTWPHHFDHGVYVPFEFDSQGNATRSFSVGYAVADSIIEEPYFYVTQWKKDEEVDYSNTPELKYGKWLPEKLKGAALSLSEILKMEDQSSEIHNFLKNTCQFSSQ